jgi:hypothetical protein
MKVGRLRLIFRLPEIIGLYNEAPAVWPKHHFAYVEWLTLSSAPGAHHNMYSVNKPRPLDVAGHLPGDIVPLSTIRQSCQLIPHLGAGVGWPEEWKSNTVLDVCDTFLLNNWSSKYAYQTIW